MATYTDAAWSTPESDLSAAEYCQVCLIDTNESRDKIKARCHLPIRKEPGGPIYKNALRAAAGGHSIFRVKGVLADKKRSAAKTLVNHMQRAGIEVTSSALLRLAGKRAD